MTMDKDKKQTALECFLDWYDVNTHKELCPHCGTMQYKSPSRAKVEKAIEKYLGGKLGVKKRVARK